MSGPRVTGPRAIEFRVTKPRVTEARVTEPCLTKSRVTKPRLIESSLAGARLTEPRDQACVVQFLAILRRGSATTLLTCGVTESGT